MKKLSLSKLETFLKSQCDALRGSMDASEYKDYLIAMIFLKRVNDQFAVAQEHFKKELKCQYPNITDEEIAEEIELDSYKNKYEFFVPPLARWKMDTLPKNFEQEQLNTINQANEILTNPNSTNQEKAGAEHDKACAEKNLSFRGLLYENEDVGNSINIALKELEKSNGAILQGVLTGKEGNSTNFNETNTNGERNSIKKEIKVLEKRISAYKKSKDFNAQEEILKLESEIQSKTSEMTPYQNIVDELNAKIKTHTDLDEELKECRRIIKAITQRKDKLVEEAREKITDEEAEELIVARWNRTIHSIVDAYIEEFARNLQLDIEHTYEKYTVTLKNILSDRDKVTADLNKYLEELGYATV